jgi:hypothetical protein
MIAVTGEEYKLSGRVLAYHAQGPGLNPNNNDNNNIIAIIWKRKT